MLGQAPFELVVLVASLGGLAATSSVLGKIPATFPLPIMVVQHRTPTFDDRVYAGILEPRSALTVRVAGQGDAIDGVGVVLVPGGAYARLNSERRLRLSPPRRRWPDLGGDHLFCSAADATAGALIAVVLTGRLQDGAQGVRAVKRTGGRVLAEDPSTAAAAEMPSAAIATGCVDHVLPVDKIPAALVALAMAPGGADLLAVPTPAWADLGASQPLDVACGRQLSRGLA